MTRSPDGTSWYPNPVSVANYTIALYGAYYRGDDTARYPLLVNANWLYWNNVVRQDHVGRQFRTYEYPIPVPAYKAPVGWRSALAGAEAINALYLASIVSGNPAFDQRGAEMFLPFDLPIEYGGYRYPLLGAADPHTVWYEEVAHPAAVRSHTLDDNLWVILAMDWYGQQAGNATALRLANDGLRGLQYALHNYDENGRSVYDLYYRTLSCYHQRDGHVPLLKQLYERFGVELFDIYYKRWLATSIACVD